MSEWEDRYAVGIESIDKDHMELFAVINRVYKIIRMGGNTRWAVAEAIKYFKNYTVRHFRSEEEFMLSVNYSGYEHHKRIHDGMRDRIIPKLYSRLEYNEYSPESVEQFLSISEKWLSRHILGHDRDLVKWVDKAANF